jgi:hypothetical protein
MGKAEATELRLYIDNDGDLYRSTATPIRKNLVLKQARDQYKHDLAVKAFGYLVEAGAKKYAKEFGGTWYQMFDVPTRKAVAEALTRHFEIESDLGNYDYLLPKKYQALAKLAEHEQTRRVATARKAAHKTAAQLNREIAAALAKRR